LIDDEHPPHGPSFQPWVGRHGSAGVPARWRERFRPTILVVGNRSATKAAEKHR